MKIRRKKKYKMKKEKIQRYIVECSGKSSIFIREREAKCVKRRKKR
jgi:hypothetical protein